MKYVLVSGGPLKEGSYNVQASNPLFYFQSIKIILGPSDTWSMRRSTQRPSNPAYYIEDCRIFGPFSGSLTTVYKRRQLHCLAISVLATYIYGVGEVLWNVS